MINKEMKFIADALDRSTILAIVMISILVSMLSLSIPLSAQTLINIIAFGKLYQPVIILSLIVFILMVSLGALYVWQIVIVEVVQQKLMVKIGLNLSYQFTHLSLDSFSTHHGPELVNRFFEVVTIKKSLANLLLYGINLGLQIFFGLLLLLFYHPLFLVFDAFIILGLLLVIFIPYRKALKSAEDECLEKHQIGAWLEEILLNRYLFRFDLHHRFATKQVDKRMVLFLKARNRHFKQLLKHQIGFYSLSALASSILLGLGGYLVINNQLSLGQLVAAEIVLGALMYSFSRFGALLENYYDLKASQSKLEGVLQLPIDYETEDVDEVFIPIQSIQIKMHNNNEASATSDNPLLITSVIPDNCQKFTEELLGFRKNGSFDLFVNDSLCSEKNRAKLRHYSQLIGKPQWFAGTIYDNLLLNQKQISNKMIIEALKNVGIYDKIMYQSEGLKTFVYEWQTVFTELELTKFMIARALILKPQLLIVDRVFDGLHQDVDKLITQLLRVKDSVLLIVSQHSSIKKITNHLVLPE